MERNVVLGEPGRNSLAAATVVTIPAGEMVRSFPPITFGESATHSVPLASTEIDSGI